MAYTSGKQCQNKSCGNQDQASFCIPITFGQSLVAGAGGVLVPLSNTAQNTDNIYGVLKLKFNASLSQAIYKLYVYNATSVTNQLSAAYLNLGQAGTNGPTAVILYSGPNRNVDGLLSSGLLSNKDVIGVSTAGYPTTNSISSLYSAIRQGALYVTINSTAFTGGIIRGQVYFRTNSK